ncbi:hypothetical protein [Stenotrophomonas maltophilia]|uniref:Uncharacterized protein n=1 Tax=Stenotrophomonas maltophilia TaxID=40324 RepID=A0A246I5J9_STEMA|nr:hypothetical protein [Stenotrophomonas maltophilia]OWQ73822.1 hypothetical protein CEE63_11755 [Stenotrophomonas maltophilia]
MNAIAQTMEDMQAEIARLRAELQNAAKAALDAVALSCEKEREADRLRAEVEAYRKDAERWQHARKLLSVDDIAECQRTLEEWNFLISEDECKRADEAIDAAMGASA